VRNDPVKNDSIGNLPALDAARVLGAISKRTVEESIERQRGSSNRDLCPPDTWHLSVCLPHVAQRGDCPRLENILDDGLKRSRLHQPLNSLMIHRVGEVP
jgi:hypothetical protein